MKLLSIVKRLLVQPSPLMADFLKHPRKISLWIEEKNPGLARRFLSYASDILEPYWFAGGLKVESLNDRGIRLILPYSWRHRSWNGGFYQGALVSLAELALQLYWERQMDPARFEISIETLTLRLDQAICEDVLAQVSMSPEAKDQTMFEVQAKGRAELSLEVPFYSRGQQRLGAVEFHLALRSSERKLLT